MSIVLNLNPETEAGLIARARANGMEPDQYLLSLVEIAVRKTGDGNETDAAARRDAVRRMMEFGEHHHLDLGEPVTRAILHEEHRL